MNKFSLIERFLFSNVSIMRNKGLSYGSFGTSLSMLCSDLFQEEEITQALIKTLTKSLSCVITGSDNSFDTGKLGVGCGLLFLKINNILDSEFDNIFAVSHQQIIDELEFRQGLHQITDISYILHCMIYSYLLKMSESSLTFSTVESDSLFSDCVRAVSDQMDTVSNYFQFETLSITIKEFLTYCKLTNKNRNSIINLYNKYICFGDNAGYLIKDVDLFRLALSVIPTSEENLCVMSDKIQSIANNAAIETCDYLHYIGLKNLVRSFSVISEKKSLDVAFEQDIDDLTFLSMCNPSTLMTLRGGFSRKYIYSSKSLLHTDAILL